MREQYDLIIVGTGFASSFFLMRYLENGPKNARILVLERGDTDNKAWQLQNRRTSSIDFEQVAYNATPNKLWLTSPGFGGNSKCWWAGAMRMMPNDFKLRTRYGVGYDWPVSYDDLEAHYCVAEQVMSVSGPSDAPMPRSRPYPQPPHRFSTPDEMLKKQFPDHWFHPPTARSSVVTPQRAACCASGICDLCPLDAKFTIQNGLAHIYQDPRVQLKLHATVDTLDIAGNLARGVHYTLQGEAHQADADLVVLGASALFNPHIMLRSGMTHPLLGRRLHDQYEMDVCVDLAGVKAYDGGTVISGNGYLFYDGEHRRDYAGCMIELWTSPFQYQDAPLRAEVGRWNERQYFRFFFDDIPLDENLVTVNAANPKLAETRFYTASDYAKRGAARIPQMLEKLSEGLPIERLVAIEEAPTTAHIQGTTVMGDDPATSVVDRYQVHHQVRNLLVLGSGSFPTSTPILPTLTLSALSLWTADHVLAKGAANA